MIEASGEIGIDMMVERGYQRNGCLLLSVLIPIFNGKGDTMSCVVYRGVKLLTHAMKIVERVLEKRRRSTVW